MLIQTRDFGEFEIKDSEVLTFPEGVLAFEDTHKFVIISDDDNDGSSGFMWLQSAEGQDPCFVVLDPFLFISDYAPELSQDALKRVQADSAESLRFLVITVIRDRLEDTTINLRSPIVLNIEKNIGAQIVLENSRYSVRHRLFSDELREVL